MGEKKLQRKSLHPTNRILQGISMSLRQFDDDDLERLRDKIDEDLKLRLVERVEMEGMTIRRASGL